MVPLSYCSGRYDGYDNSQTIHIAHDTRTNIYCGCVTIVLYEYSRGLVRSSKCIIDGISADIL